MDLNEQLNINLNGVPQFVSIRAEKAEAPLLVYLHGGPGDMILENSYAKNNQLWKRVRYYFWTSICILSDISCILCA